MRRRIRAASTPEHEGIAPHHSSAPREPKRFADFCAEMVERYRGMRSGASRSAAPPEPRSALGTY